MKSLLATVFATLLCVSFANADVDSSLRRLENVIKNNVPANNRPQLLEAFDKLTADLNKLQCVDEGAQQSSLPACKLLGYGLFNSYHYNYRIENNGLLLTAADSITKMFTEGKKFEDRNVCKMQAVECSVIGYGLFNTYLYNYRIITPQGILIHANDSSTGIYDDLAEFKKLKICK